MRKLLLLTTFVTACCFAFAQPLGNEWIDYSRTHYKIKVTQDGIYRIPYATLSSVISNISTVNAANFALYHNGKQVPIYITTNGNLGSSDYIEFYGRKNIGDVDSFLYRNGNLQPHPYHSLYTDTSVYFLTVRSTGGNLRITETANILLNLPAAEQYFMHTERQVYAGRYYEGVYYSIGPDEIYKPAFEDGEGYVNSAFFGTISSGNPSQQTQLTFTIPTPAIYTSGPAATYYTVYANNSKGNDRHSVNIALNNNGGFYTQPQVTGFQLHKKSFTVPLSQLNNGGNNTFTFTETYPGNTSKKQNCIYLNQLTYPRQFNFGGQNTFRFKLGANANKTYLEITNFNDEGQNPLLYDVTNGVLIKSTTSPGSSPIKFALPPSTVEREIYLISGTPSTYNVVNQITPIQFERYDGTDFNKVGDYLIIYNKVLTDDGNGNNRVEEYRRYRDMDENPGTGQYRARMYDIDQLYDQFAYGVRKSPLAIRNFIQYAVENWSLKPTHVFLLGKGREFNFMRNSSNANNQCLIPTFGYPGSDNLYSSSRDNDIPYVAIGRLAAETPSQIADYLQKVKDYELELATYDEPQSIDPKNWHKQTLFFSGGTSSIEQDQFTSYVSSYARLAADTLWGAVSKTYSRTSNAPIPQSQAQEITNKINSGVSLITFFGHSATGAFDFSIDEPENYTNYRKYPVFLSNGCFAGLVHDVQPGYSERFVFKQNAGAIAFIATTSLSGSTGLHNFSTKFYKRMAGQAYTRTIGQILQGTLADVYTGSPGNIDVMVAQEFTLHGDPAIKLYQYGKPDYAIEQSSLYFTPATITPAEDTFEVNLIITNLGKAIRDSIAVTIKRTAFDANTGSAVSVIFKKVVKAPYYKDTVMFRVPTLFSSVGYGENRFEAYVDADFEIDEMSELNNGLSETAPLNYKPVVIYIRQDDILPIHPYEFAIVPNQGVILKASTVDPFAPVRNYRFEMDTTELFNSNMLLTQVVNQGGGVVSWAPPTVLKDSVVYYWRVAIDSTVPNWHYSSFIYLKDEYPGWNQSHFYQWQKDNFVNIAQGNDRLFRFPPNVNTVKVITGIADAVGGSLNADLLGWDYNNNNMHRYRMGGCPTGGQQFTRGITFAVIDSITGLPWASRNDAAPVDNWGDLYGNWHCSNKAAAQYGFDFSATGTHPTSSGQPWSGVPWSQAIKNFVDAIPAGHYVLAYSTNNPSYGGWDTTLIQTLQNLGFAQITQYTSGQISGPFVFFTQKGNPGYPSFIATRNGYTPAMDTTFTFNGVWYQGNFSSPLIGPAMEWGSMHWYSNPMENPTADLDTVDVIGVDYSGNETILLTTTQPNNFINNISATQYPFLKLRLRTFDDSLRTPTQMKYWRVLYKKAPEAAMNPAAHFVFQNNLPIGGNLQLELGLENVTDVPMDSMLTYYNLRDASFVNYLDSVRYDSLKGLTIMHLTYNRPITGNNYLGANKIIVEANPNNDQLEQFHFNNFAELDFNTTGDKINPLLDVTFDGRHIFNGDIVSAKPNILITLKDENTLLALNDTALINVFLKHPGENTLRRMDFDDVVMKFYPADSTNLAKNNKAQIELKPTLPVDGTYELIVKGRDRSNNTSSKDNYYEGNQFYDYKIAFEVINKPMVTNVLNYPNPFTTATKFIFTLTGTQVPDYMKIQIMTIKGTVVKEITKDELGELHIGRNITEYTWNGRDEYGDLLANGVYFYRVVTRLDDKQMDHMSQGYDKYFKKGFGKMVIVR